MREKPSKLELYKNHGATDKADLDFTTQASRGERRVKAANGKRTGRLFTDLATMPLFCQRVNEPRPNWKHAFVFTHRQVF